MCFTIIGISYFYKYGDLSGSHYANYINTLALVGTILAATAFIYQYTAANNLARSDKLREYIRELREYIIDFEKMFIDKYPSLSRLYQQIYSDIPSHNFNNISEEANSYETHVCAIMFQIIENVYLENFQTPDSYQDAINIAWINKWKSWFKSDIVKEQWKYRRHFYTTNTQKFIDNQLNT